MAKRKFTENQDEEDAKSTKQKPIEMSNSELLKKQHDNAVLMSRSSVEEMVSLHLFPHFFFRHLLISKITFGVLISFTVQFRFKLKSTYPPNLISHGKYELYSMCLSARYMTNFLLLQRSQNSLNRWMAGETTFHPTNLMATKYK